MKAKPHFVEINTFSYGKDRDYNVIDSKGNIIYARVTKNIAEQLCENLNNAYEAGMAKREGELRK